MTNAILLRSRMTRNCHVRFWSRVGQSDLLGLDTYKSSREASNELINFSDLIDEEDAEAVINCCRENNIKEFTISSNSTGMIRSIMALEAQGCRLIGTTMINRDNLRIDAKQIPAFKIEIL